MSYVSNGRYLVDRCPHCHCHGSDYLPLPDLMAVCHDCGTRYQRRWVRQEDVDEAVTTALRTTRAKRGAA